MKQWFEWRHLGIADTLNKRPKKNPVVHYFIHMYIGFKEGGKQLFMAFASFVHAIFPPLFNFKLLEMIINQAIGLHKYLPQQPGWKKLRDELNKNSK